MDVDDGVSRDVFGCRNSAHRVVDQIDLDVVDVEIASG